MNTEKQPQNPPPVTLNESEASILDYCRRIEAENDREEASSMLDALTRSMDWEKATPTIQQAWNELLTTIHLTQERWNPPAAHPPVE